MITVVPGLVLSLLETILLAAVSLAVSTRVGMIPNLIICFAIYVLGHLVPLIVQSSVGKLAIVRFVGRLSQHTPCTRTFHNRGRCDWWRSGAVGISRMGSNLRRFIFCDSLTHRTCTSKTVILHRAVQVLLTKVRTESKPR